MKKINFALYTRESGGVTWQVEGQLTPDEEDMVSEEANKIVEIIKDIEKKLNKK